MRDAAHRRQHCCAIIEDLACSGLNLQQQPTVVGLIVGIIAEITLLYCCAVLCCAVLCCVVLCCAVLCCAVLCCAVLCCAVLCCAVPCCAVQAAAVRVECVCFHRGLRKTLSYCQKALLNATNNKICTWSKKGPSAYFAENHVSCWSICLKHSPIVLTLCG